MDQQTRALIEQYVHENIDDFHAKRLAKIKGVRLNGLISNKNPYLFRAKHYAQASDFITALLNAQLSSGEETSFGRFLEGLAVYVAQITGNGVKSGVKGIDIELTRGDVRYLIAVKSGKKWGNDDQRNKLREHFRTVVKVLRQNEQVGQLQPVEGICYGKFFRGNKGVHHYGDYVRMIGQAFWYLISDDREFYADLIEPLGHEAEAHAKSFEEERAATHNRLSEEFIVRFCDPQSKKIDWPKVVRFVSENMPPRERPPMLAWLEQLEREAAEAGGPAAEDSEE